MTILYDPEFFLHTVKWFPNNYNLTRVFFFVYTQYVLVDHR